jgi:hypothetical protein
VVSELCGTITVVFFSGGAGLLLLMQPASIPAAKTKLVSIFIENSVSVGVPEPFGDRVEYGKEFVGRAAPGARGGIRIARCALSYTRDPAAVMGLLALREGRRLQVES